MSGVDTGSLQIELHRDCEWEFKSRPHSSSSFSTAEYVIFKGDAVHKGEEQSKIARRVWSFKEEILGATPMGKGLFLQ